MNNFLNPVDQSDDSDFSDESEQQAWNVIDHLLLNTIKANHLIGHDTVICDHCDEPGRVSESFSCVICNKMTCDNCRWFHFLAVMNPELLTSEELLTRYPQFTKDRIEQMYINNECVCRSCSSRS